MKGQNWPISCIKKYRDNRRYRDIFWCFQTMQYIAFAIYRDKKCSALNRTLAMDAVRVKQHIGLCINHFKHLALRFSWSSVIWICILLNTICAGPLAPFMFWTKMPLFCASGLNRTWLTVVPHGKHFVKWYYCGRNPCAIRVNFSIKPAAQASGY